MCRENSLLGVITITIFYGRQGRKIGRINKKTGGYTIGCCRERGDDIRRDDKCDREQTLNLTPGGYRSCREMFLDEAKSTQWCKHVTGMSIIRQTDVFEQLSHRLSRVCHAWVSTRTQSITLHTRGWRARNVNSCECVFCPHPAKMWETLGFISREERSASGGTCKPATEGLVWVRRLTSWRMRKCATGWEVRRYHGKQLRAMATPWHKGGESFSSLRPWRGPSLVWSFPRGTGTHTSLTEHCVFRDERFLMS